jgi:hypothetical protein
MACPGNTCTYVPRHSTSSSVPFTSAITTDVSTMLTVAWDRARGNAYP